MVRKKIWLVWLLFTFFLLGLGYLALEKWRFGTFADPVGPKRIIVIGDEYAAGLGASSPKMAFAQQLADSIGWEIEYFTKEKLSSLNLNEFITDSGVLEQEAGIVLLALGLHEDTYSVPNDASATQFHLAFRRLLYKFGPMVVFAAMESKDRGWRFKVVVQRARDVGVLMVHDVLGEVWDNPHLQTESSAPNDAGHTLVAQKILEAIRANADSL